MRTIAIIDMGTNTFHLLMATVDINNYQILRRDHEGVKIGMSGINEGFINPDACQRAITAMKRFREIIDDHGISEVHAFATSAFRNTKNGKELAAEIEKATSIAIRIISGEEEAGLIFAGIRAALEIGTEPGLVMDIGAGSVEFIIGNNDGIMWKKSFEIGGQRLLEKFQRHDPILPDEIDALNVYFESVLSSLLSALSKYKPSTLIGSSGTFDTLSDIYCIRRNIPRTFNEAETPLTLSAFEEIYLELIKKNREQRMKIEGMIELRADMIVVACCLIRFVLDKHAFSNIRVSTYSLKEGVLATLARSAKS